MSKIKAFTLIEMVLALLLAAIVIGMSYSAFTVFSRLYKNHHDKNLDHAGLRIFKQVLDLDMAKAQWIELDEGRLNFLDTLNASALSYSFAGDYLLRTHDAAIDTFDMKSLVLRVSFEGTEVNSGIVDHVVLRFEHAASPMTIAAAKIYSSVELFNYQNMAWKR